MRQLARRKSSQFFKVQEIHLYYNGWACFMSMLDVDPSSLAKLAKRIGDLRHRLAIMITESGGRRSQNSEE